MSDKASQPILSVQRPASGISTVRRWSPGSLFGLLRIVGRRLWSHLALMLAISVLMALSDAVASVGGYKVYPALDAPATPERILMAVERLKRRTATRAA